MDSLLVSFKDAKVMLIQKKKKKKKKKVSYLVI